MPIILAVAWPGACAAQALSSDWAGAYVGVDLGGRLAEDVRAHGVIAPYQYPGYRYVNPPYTTAPASVGFTEQTDFGGSPVGGVHIGYLTAIGNLVLGVEGQVETGRNTNSISAANTYPSDDLNICGPGAAGCLQGPASDAFLVRSSIDWSGSLRARLGLPLGERVLLSAFAGPSFLSATIKTSQFSNAQAELIFFDRFHFLVSGVQVPPAMTQRAQSLTAVGGTLGAAIAYRLDSHWILNAEYGFSVYPSYTVRLPEGGGTTSFLTYQPIIHTMRLGISFRF